MVFAGLRNKVVVGFLQKAVSRASILCCFTAGLKNLSNSELNLWERKLDSQISLFVYNGFCRFVTRRHGRRCSFC